jgi:hypothetical protein
MLTTHALLPSTFIINDFTTREAEEVLLTYGMDSATHILPTGMLLEVDPSSLPLFWRFSILPSSPAHPQAMALARRTRDPRVQILD